MLLAEHLAEKFNAELGDGGDDVRKNPKAMAKLIRQARSATLLVFRALFVVKAMIGSCVAHPDQLCGSCRGCLLASHCL